MKPLRVQVWGAGFMAAKWLEQLAGRADIDVTGIASRHPDRARERVRAAGLAHVEVLPNWDTPVHRTEPTDAVIVTLPQALHPEATLKALQAGWHVLVEKPLALNLEDARRVYLAAAACPALTVMVNQNFRWRPHVQALRRALAAGLIGRVEQVFVECRQQIRRTTIDGWRERLADPFLLDFAIHHFDLIRYLLGDEPRALTGRSFRPAWSWFDGATAAAATIEMAGGAIVSYGGTMVSTGFDTPQEGLITCVGEHGTLCLDGASRVQHATAGAVLELPQSPVTGGELGYALDEFLAAIAARRQPEVSLGEHIRSLAMSCGVIEASGTGSQIPCDPLVAFL